MRLRLDLSVSEDMNVVASLDARKKVVCTFDDLLNDPYVQMKKISDIFQEMVNDRVNNL